MEEVLVCAIFEWCGSCFSLFGLNDTPGSAEGFFGICSSRAPFAATLHIQSSERVG
jgi:hypothetical protein